MADEQPAPIRLDESDRRTAEGWPPSLRSALLEAVDRQFELGTPISMSLQEVHTDTNYPTFKASLQFEGGAEEIWFVKDMGHRARWTWDPVRQRQCEVNVYRDLLNDADLGTPRMLFDREGSGGSHWLILEFVEGTPLKWMGFDWWRTAVTWLGRKDAYFQARSQALSQHAYLNRLDESNFSAVGSLAEAGVREGAPDLTRRLERVLAYHDEVIPDLVWGAWTLVHGHYRPSQIVVQTGPEPARVCPVDWETAGHGSPVCDLASLCEGFERERLDAMLKAYRDSAKEHGADVPTLEDLHRTIEAQWIHRELKRVVKSFHRGWDVDHVDRFIDRAEHRIERHQQLSETSP